LLLELSVKFINTLCLFLHTIVLALDDLYGFLKLTLQESNFKVLLTFIALFVVDFEFAVKLLRVAAVVLRSGHSGLDYWRVETRSVELAKGVTVASPSAHGSLWDFVHHALDLDSQVFILINELLQQVRVVTPSSLLVLERIFKLVIDVIHIV
jgi:hypothetical protein